MEQRHPEHATVLATVACGNALIITIKLRLFRAVFDSHKIIHLLRFATRFDVAPVRTNLRDSIECFQQRKWQAQRPKLFIQ